LLIVYAALVFVFQYATLTRQIFHDEVQDVATVEGLLYFDAHNTLQLRQDYYSRPQSHLLVDRMMEVRDLAGNVLYRSATLQGQPLGGAIQPREGNDSFNERILRLGDGRHVFVISHIHGMGNRTLIIRLGYSLVPLRNTMFRFLALLLIALPVALALSATAGQKIAKRALLPLEEMAVSAESIGAANMHDRLSIANPNDELGQLAAVINHLLQRLEEAFKQLERFTADAAHELRTPLASLRAVGELALQEEQSRDGYREALSSILEETSRLNETINSLLLLARVEATDAGHHADEIAIGPLIAEVLGVLAVLIEEQHIRVIHEGQQLSQVTVAGDRSLLRVAFLNVMHNAIKFSPDGADLRVSLVQPTEAGRVIRIVVADQGPGLAPGEHELVFERFVRGSATATIGGSGVGLSVAKLITERAGGKIWFDDEVVRGATCVIELPQIVGRDLESS
jgi:signal transduction histidine kinase